MTRTTFERRPIASLAFAFLLFASLVAETSAATREPLGVRYLRGVHVLRLLSPGEHWPPLAVPRRIQTDDTANALVLHPDKYFVLASITRDLAAATASGKHPDAGYYAAHALAMQGKHADAAKAMNAYIANTSFHAENYLFLLRHLYASGKYAELQTTAQRWQLLETPDLGCSEERLTYVWGSLYATGRHRDAMEAVLSDPCASWRGQLLFARSCLALGDEEGAQKRIDSVLETFPEKEREIRILWNRLYSADRYP